MTIFCIFFLLGGSGMLGQHIVRLIEERDPTVKEIRIVDLRPYENRLSKYIRGKRREKNVRAREREINFCAAAVIAIICLQTQLFLLSSAFFINVNKIKLYRERKKIFRTVCSSAFYTRRVRA